MKQKQTISSVDWLKVNLQLAIILSFAKATCPTTTVIFNYVFNEIKTWFTSHSLAQILVKNKKTKKQKQKQKQKQKNKNKQKQKSTLSINSFQKIQSHM